jgi:Fe-S-cluster containining protein
MINKCENCGICCLDTEMVLFDSDIDLIIKNSNLPLKKKDFTKKNLDGMLQLANIDGHCFFFNTDNKTCNIYEYRPQGCRFYPLIFDISEDKCILDKDCPRPKLFYHRRNSEYSNCIDLKEYLKKNKIIK